jgi:hypothetical protein
VQTSSFFAPGGYSVSNYYGYVLVSSQAEERGIFVVVVNEYAESFESVTVG